MIGHFTVNMPIYLSFCERESAVDFALTQNFTVLYVNNSVVVKPSRSPFHVKSTCGCSKTMSTTVSLPLKGRPMSTHCTHWAHIVLTALAIFITDFGLFVFYLLFPSVPSKAVGIESRVIGDSDISSSSVLNQHFADHARLNELGEFWCSNTTDVSSWLQVFLGRQYTLTHIAIQGINEFDVRAMTVKYEKTRDGENWITYSKHLGGNVNAKVVCVFCLLRILKAKWSNSVRQTALVEGRKLFIISFFLCMLLIHPS